MGSSCGCLGNSFYELYDEAKHSGVFVSYNFDNLSLQEIDEKLEENKKKFNKYSKIKTNDLQKRLKIATVRLYLTKQINDLSASKLRIIELKNTQDVINIINICRYRENQKFHSHMINLCYNIGNIKFKKRDYYIPPENFEYLPFESVNDIKNKGDWIDAYHGTGRNCQNEEEVKEMIKSIFNNGFKNGFNNVHANCDDICHPGKKVNIGVYVTPNIEIAKDYAGIIKFNGEEYCTVFLVKVKSASIRKCNCPDARDYWVVNGSPNEIIPVKILYTRR